MIWVDWLIVASLLVLMVGAAIYTKRYSLSVADFLAANRCAGRYVLGVAEGIAGVGAITIVALFEAYYEGGFSFAWWGLVLLVVTIVISMTGWVQYRYRETRALTLAQFLEQRYSRNFRVFAGMLIFVSGTINFGIFPAVGARFFMKFCGFQSYLVHLGAFELDLTFAGIMILLLGVALVFTFLGGQIAVIVTDFIQGSFFNLLLCVTVAFLMLKFPWDHIIEALQTRPAGESMIHPFHSGKTADFNIWFYLIQAFGIFYCFMAWQGNQGYYASARNAHEARMGRVLGSWRDMTQRLLILIIPVCAFAVMHHAHYTDTAVAVQGVLDGIGNETLQKQLTTTVVLNHILPAGVLGAFTAVMLAAFISTHDTYLHSWGSIFIQDVVLPFRKTRPTQAQHMRMLRRSIFGVAIFIFFFSLLFPQDSPVLMYFALTGTIWLGGAGAVIVGGLYWRRGTTEGAYTSLFIGVVTALAGFFLPRVWEGWFGRSFPLNAQWLWLIAMLCSTVGYVGVSLLSGHKPCDMDKLLHRGPYAVPDDAAARSDQPVRGWRAVMGMGPDFSFGDRVLYLIVSGWSVLWAIIFVVGTVYNLTHEVSDEAWASFWHFYVWLILFSGIATTIWFTIGGLIDLRYMFRRLREVRRDATDDGTVTEHLQDLADAEGP
jgi:SSS family solute:Na+ symporter